MRCGLCVKSCPTYLLSQSEPESPRSRVQSLRKVLSEQQALTGAEQQHLANCLQCRACETVCPSQMAYAAAFDQAQSQLAPGQTNWSSRMGFVLIGHKHWRQTLLPLLTLYLRSGLQQPIRASGLLKKLGLAEAEALLQSPSLSPLHRLYPIKKSRLRGRVALFTGCLAEHFDRPVQLAAIKLLNALGYEVVIPHDQVCCGAIHQHHGRNPQALLAKNAEVFYNLEVTAVLYSASGCGAMLSEQLAPDTETSGWLLRHLYDINDFLLQHWPDQLRLAASNLTVAVHEPCSQRHVLKNQHNLYLLLGKIPHLELTAVSENTICCGAGGSYMLSHPETADKLRRRKQQQLSNSGADLIVSSNFACRYYLNASQTDSSLKVLHPLQLLADRL